MVMFHRDHSHPSLHCLYTNLYVKQPQSLFSLGCGGCGCCSKLLGVELLPMMLLASQELSARAATRDQHLRTGAQPLVPKITTSKIRVLTRQRPFKNRFLLYLKASVITLETSLV